MKKNEVGWYWNGLVGAIFMAGNWLPLRWFGFFIFVFATCVITKMEHADNSL